MRNELFERAVGLARKGRKDEARAVLKRVLEWNPRHEPAWLWYVDCLTKDEDRIRALEECLRLIPTSTRARRVLDLLRKRRMSIEVGGETVPLAEDRARRESSDLFSFKLDDLPEGPPAAPPFTVSPDEVSPVEIEIAEHQMLAALQPPAPPLEPTPIPATEPTQPVRVRPPPFLPDEEELRALFEQAEEGGPPSPPARWVPIFSDEVPGRPLASANLRTRPRPVTPLEPPKPPPSQQAASAALPTQPRAAQSTGWKARLNALARSTRREDILRVLLILSVGAGVILILSVMALVLLLTAL